MVFASSSFCDSCGLLFFLSWGGGWLLFLIFILAALFVQGRGGCQVGSYRAGFGMV